MGLSIEALEAQLSVAELLASMFYGEGELEIDDDNSALLVTLREYLESPSRSESSPVLGNVHIMISLAIDDSRTLALTVVLHLRASVRVSRSIDIEGIKQSPLVELSIKHPSWLSRTSYEELLAFLPPYTGSSSSDVQSVEDGRDWLMQTIEHLQSESTTSKLLTQPTSLSLPAPTPEITGDELVTRAWFYLPSLSTRSKRTDILNLAPEYSISGFVLAGKPGLLCLESPTPHGPDNFISRIKTESWADIPAHQKKISERFRESGVKRAFVGMSEVTDIIRTRGQRANRGDMGEVRVFLEERGLKGVLEIVLGANEFK
ncbi:DUF1115 domain protein [Ceratobasidium sp. AG-I]|nr:DUF1115 domain protein [Ceratobasidium sp. AG-I]